MSDHGRPGGLTALAIFNFVGAGIVILGILFLFLALLVISGIIEIETQEGIQQTIKGGVPSLLLLIVLYVLICVLLIVSGIGYLKLKKFSGRTLGNSYAVASLLTLALELFLTNEPMGLLSLIGFIYPLLTVYLLNKIFKEDFVN